MARDLSVDYDKLRKWSQRRRIPTYAWPGLITAAKAKRGKTVTLEQLVAAHQPRRSASAA